MVTGLINNAGLDPYEDYVAMWNDDFFQVASLPSYAFVNGPAFAPPNNVPAVSPVLSSTTWFTSSQWKAWAYPTDDPRALDYPGLDTGIAAYWFALPGSNIVSDIEFTDGQTHQVAMYCTSWTNTTWSQRVDILDAWDGTVLDTRTLTRFGSGIWLVWDITGHVQIRVTCLAGSAAVSGFFFGASAAPGITEQPGNVTIATGQTATFQVDASGLPLFYQWQRSSDGGNTWANLSGATAATYSLVANANDNGAMFDCVVSNNNGWAITDPAWLVVNGALPPPPVITSPLIVSAYLYRPFYYVITATNNPTSFDAFLPPQGWALDTQQGLLSGSAELVFGQNESQSVGPGILSIPISAINAGGADNETLTVIVNTTNAPSVTNAVLSATGMVGVAFSYTIAATTNAKSYTATALPPGLTLNTVNGAIYGLPTPAATGTTNVYIGAVNASGTGWMQLSITILGAPAITTQPADLSLPAGRSATFSVTATGTAPLFYQWMKGGISVVGATGTVYSIASAALTDAGLYSVSVSNSVLGMTSRNAALTVTTGAVAPAITTQPVSLVSPVGHAATFNVSATGTSPLWYQWSENGTNIAGATGASYTIPSVAPFNAGTYSVLVGNGVGSVSSGNALLTVTNCLVTWWKFDETSGTAAMDSSGYANTGTVQSAATWTNGVYQGALYMNGSSTYVSSRIQTNSPNEFTEAIWFCTTNTRGGELIGFANTKVNLSATQDRVVYMNSSGKVVFGVATNGYQTIMSPQSYYDGCWHHAAATLSSAGMALYLDGSCVGINASVTGTTNYLGYWRVGYDQLGAWPTGNGRNFQGCVDDARIYARALSASEISELCGFPLWQLANFGSITAVGAASNTVNSAGISNYQMFLAGSNPNDPNTWFRTTTLAPMTGRRWGMNFNTVPGKLYTITWKTNLQDGTGWQFYTTVIGQGGTANVFFTNALPQAFFQVQAQ